MLREAASVSRSSLHTIATGIEASTSRVGNEVSDLCGHADVVETDVYQQCEMMENTKTQRETFCPAHIRHCSTDKDKYCGWFGLCLDACGITSYTSSGKNPAKL